MKSKTAVILSVVWTLVVLALCGGAIWYVQTHTIPGVRTEDRASQLGRGMGFVAGIGYGCILIPWAVARSRSSQESKSRTRKQRRRR